MSECDLCFYFTEDDDGEWQCEVELDEDEYARFLCDRHKKCPYFSDADDYKIVAHQA